MTPGTAEVSGKSCALFTLVGETPGTSNATSRKLRPFNGRFLTSGSETVLAIWLRAASSTVTSAVTVTLASRAPTASVTGNSNAEPDGECQAASRHLEPGLANGDFVRTDTQIGKPEASFLVG